ncbi:hypothetical protein R1flu_013137 [Riccia fluitans]|uniref:Bifunctional inhibitor/plant lipid transfer protein/seed storage helical domain-containing protein n=1 Tax=Riccia fluitans TaxID=41844 RepID=A0ABD1XEE2_9MARC
MSISSKMSMVLLVALLCTVPLALGQASPPLDCADALANLFPCLDFVSGLNNTVSSECCTGLTGVRTNTPLCLCQFLTANASDLGINTTLALELPGKCGVSADPSQCPGSGPAPAAAPPANPPVAPPTVAPVTPPVSAPVTPPVSAPVTPPVSAPVPSTTPAPPMTTPSPVSSPPTTSPAPSSTPPTTSPAPSSTPPATTPSPVSPATTPSMAPTTPSPAAAPTTSPIKAPTVAPTVSPVSAPSPPVDCTSTITLLNPCLSFVVRATADSPSADCCGNFSSIASKTPACLCTIVSADRNTIPGLNITRALELPDLCKAAFNPATCSAPTPPPAGELPPPSAGLVTAASPFITIVFVVVSALQLFL